MTALFRILLTALPAVFPLAVPAGALGAPTTTLTSERMLIVEGEAADETLKIVQQSPYVSVTGPPGMNDPDGAGLACFAFDSGATASCLDAFVDAVIVNGGAGDDKLEGRRTSTTDVDRLDGGAGNDELLALDTGSCVCRLTPVGGGGRRPTYTQPPVHQPARAVRRPRRRPPRRGFRPARTDRLRRRGRRHLQRLAAGRRPLRRRGWSRHLQLRHAHARARRGRRRSGDLPAPDGAGRHVLRGHHHPGAYRWSATPATVWPGRTTTSCRTSSVSSAALPATTSRRAWSGPSWPEAQATTGSPAARERTGSRATRATTCFSATAATTHWTTTTEPPPSWTRRSRHPATTVSTAVPVWAWYPNPDGIYNGTNPLIHPFN